MKSRSRAEILMDIVQFKGNLSDLQIELSIYSWDVEVPILIINKDVFLNVLKKFIDKNTSFEDIENWANVIECRDDIGFEVEKMQEIIFELANPEIQEKISKERLIEFVRQLE